MSKRPVHDIEKKWQERWEADGVYRAEDSGKAEKFYGLIEFPYPSGEGLHVGHPRSYVAIDAVTRKLRMSGKNVMYPIGWDAFGLPTENFAIKNKIKPQEATKGNIANFTRQIKSIGLGFDWSREVDTTDPKYYKWTQWQFLKFFNSFYDEAEQRARPIEELPAHLNKDEHRMAFKTASTINWCPRCKIGLANEEAQGGVCERCGNPVEKREKAQWMIRITKYAERLLKDLDNVDYLEKIKAQQINWIGKSEGAYVDFNISGSKNPFDKVTVFTTRPDTLFGATYLVLAPEHPLVATWLKEGDIKNQNEVQAYQSTTAGKSEMERTAEGKEKSGCVLKGIEAVNPANGENISIWISDYVLAGYGTGAIMAVPAHDERDFQFASKFELPIKYVVAPVVIDSTNPHREGKKTVTRPTVHAIIRNPKTDEILCMKWKHRDITTFVIGGMDEGEDPIEAAKREVREETGYTDLKFVEVLGGPMRADYFAAHKDENRVAYITAVMFDLVSDKREEVPASETDTHEPVWIPLNKIAKENLPPLERNYILARIMSKEAFVVTEPGEALNSGFLDGLPTWKAKDDMASWLKDEGKGDKAVTYKLRDWVFSRQRYWGEPIPIVICPKCGYVPVPEKELPLMLPDVDAYEPLDSGESPLAAIRDWVEVDCPNCGGKAERETDTMPNWAGSSWYFLRYCDPQNEKEFASQEKLKYWMPVDLYNGGMEHTTLHLLYSRFWYKFLWDLRIVPEECGSEPYAKRRSHGLILAEGGEKMSKSKGNVVNPDDVVGEYGADVFRVYEMFMGPFDQPVPWDTNGIEGVRKFLDKVWTLFDDEKNVDASEELVTLYNQSIKKMTDGIDGLYFNTCVSQMMIMTNAFVEAGGVPEAMRKGYLQILAPFAPHMTEELWSNLGMQGSIHRSAWPSYDESKLKASTFELVVQVNGKVRGKVTVDADVSEEDAKAMALKEENVVKTLGGKEPKQVIYVKGRLVSIVV
ncbi:class I tRNA ligase family protein [Candidatus Uhrbacteria bacterium]|nr:class I tRNA ligase family protein [Candidatus Uhrbacteria bacterium]